MAGIHRGVVLLAVVIAALLLEPSLAVAHETGFTHTDPAPPSNNGSGASTLVIFLGVVMALLTVAVLVWLKNHDFEQDDESADTSSTTA